MNELVLFESSDGAVKLNVQTDRETVWVNRAQLAELFGRDVKTIGKHAGRIERKRDRPRTTIPPPIRRPMRSYPTQN